MNKKKTYVLDTSVYLTDANAIYNYGRSDIVVPLVVFEEIDNNKKRQDGVGLNARKIIRKFDQLRTKGNLHKGVRVKKGGGIIRARGYNSDYIPSDFDPSLPDNKIIATALTEIADNKDSRVIVVSRDINMRVKCDALGIQCDDFLLKQVVKDTDELFTGLKTHLVDDQVVEKFYNNEEVILSEGEIYSHPNQFVMLISNSNEKKTALCKFISHHAPLKKILNTKNGVWGLHPRNKEQSFALDLLMNQNIPIVSLIGKAGSGKTICALAAGLELTLEKNVYKKIVVSRPVQPVGKDIGYLPGTKEDKMLPWLKPIQDNLEVLFGNDSATLEMYVDNGTIEIEAITYIRGRSISNAFIVIDEAQNMSPHELKTIITRVGENSKIVLTGDIEQIDNVYIDSTSNGLSYAVEKFKLHHLAGHITLMKGERSEVATLAADVL